MADQITAETSDVVSDTKASPSPKLDKVIFKNGIEIYPDQRLPHLDRGDVKAYAAKHPEGARAFALICENSLVPQADMLQKYMGINTPHLPKVIGYGVLRWPLDQREHVVLVYENKLGRCVTHDRNPLAVGLRAELVLNTIFRNMIEVLRAIYENNFVHGAINANNIFEGTTEGMESCMLGEMVSVPCGYNQPVLYETIPRGVSQPIGRGIASFADDLYAFGVTLAVLIRTHDPMEGFTADEIIAKKIEVSSFNAIIGQERFPGPVLELLRGLLQDHEVQRWTYEDILTWMEGRRVQAKQAPPGMTKASRPLEFMRRKYLRPQSLAIELTKDGSAAAQIIENNEIALWLNRSLQNKEYEIRYEDAVIQVRKAQTAPSFVDRLATHVAIALAPNYPFMFKNLSFFPSGFGALLVNAAVMKKDVGVFAEIIQMELMAFYSKCNSEGSQTLLEGVNKIDSCRAILQQSSIGFGIERCIYYLSPTVHCLSPKLDGYYVRSPEDYLRAMEDMSKSKNRPEWFLDRHIIAFLCARDKAVIEPSLADLNASEPYRQRQAVLRVFAAIQAREKIEPLPGLCKWLTEMLGVVVDRYHDRDERANIRSQLDKAKDKGNFNRILEILGTYDKLQVDMKSFTLAMRQYQALKTDHHNLKLALDTNKNFGMEDGRQVSAFISAIIAGVVVMIYLFFSVLR